MSKSVAIIGAGIAGLTAAHRLKQAGFNAVLFESLERPGGRMYSVRRGDYIFDLGTIGLLGGTPLLQELVAAGGLKENFSTANPLVAAIVRNGNVKRIDSGHPVRDFVQTDLLSLGGKLRAARMAWDVLKHRDLFNCEDAVGLGVLDVETVMQYAERRLGREVADYLCSPLLRAIWMADSQRNSAVQLLWTLKQMIYPMYTLNCGNGGLPSAIARAHEVRYSHVVRHIENDGHGATIHWDANGTSGAERFDACISAVPPPVAIKMAPRIEAAQRQFLENVRYTSMLAVHFGLTRRPANSETVLMYPEREAQDIAAVYVNHNKAPERAPDGKGSLSAYFTEDWSQRNFDIADYALIELACKRLRPHYGDFEAHIEEAFVHRWPLFAMAATPGIYRLMDDFQRSLRATPPSRLQFAGDFLPNSGINQAMASGAAAARRIVGALEKR